MSAVECPICMDDINVTKNCIITECGHCFHTSCVMRNVAQNGFACPMCRTAMADDVESEETEYDDDEFSLIVDQRNPDDYALRGFRMFMDNIHGVEHEREDELEEREEEEDVSRPSVDYIIQKLRDQGTTMEDLLKVLLRDHEEYDDDDEEFDSVDQRVWGELRIIIDEYQPQQVVEEAPLVEESIHPNVTVRQRTVVPLTPTTTPAPLVQAEDKPPAIRQRRPGIAGHLDSVSRVLFTDAMDE